MAYLWEKSYPSGVSWDAPLPPAVPLESLLETAASRWPERIAIDFYDRTFTFRELHDLVARAGVVNSSPPAAPRENNYQVAAAETTVVFTLALPMLYPQIAALKGTA